MATITIERKQPELLVAYGQYKEQSAGPGSYLKEAEEGGDGNIPKAAVRNPLLIVFCFADET